MKNKSAFYSLCVLLAGSLWGTISIFLNGLTGCGFSRLEVLLIRTLTSSLLLFILLFVRDRSLLKISLRDIWMFAGSGIVSLTFFSMCYFKTILETGASVAVVLLYTSPIFVLLFSAIFFKEKITVLKAVSLGLTFMGSVLVAGLLGGGTGLCLKGFLTGLGAGLGYGLYSIFGNQALKKYNSMTVTFYTFLFSALSILPFIDVCEMVSRLQAGESAAPILLGGGIAVFCTLLPYLLYTKGLSGMEPGRAAILATIEPMTGTLIGFLVFNEEFSIQKITGILLILGAIILLNLNIQNTKKAPESSSGASS